MADIMDFKKLKASILRKTNGEYELIKMGSTIQSIAEFRHSVCNRTFSKTLSMIMYKKSSCTACRQDKLTQDIADRISKDTNGEYELVKTPIYKSFNEKQLVRHVCCGTEYEIAPNNFLNQKGSRCPKCSVSQPSDGSHVTAQLFSNYLQVSDHLTRIDSLSEFIGFNEPIHICYKKCRHSQQTTPRQIITDRLKCPVCNYFKPQKIRTPESFRAEVHLLDPSYKVMSDYINGKDKVDFIHTFCNSSFKMRPNDFLSNGNRCPKCSMRMGSGSEGVIAIRNFLESKKELFFENHSLEGCVYKNKLRFDFLVCDPITRYIDMAIEFDGQQHFVKSNTSWKHSFEATQKRDIAKNEFCKANNIPLVRIRYDFPLEQIPEYLEIMLNDYRKATLGRTE